MLQEAMESKSCWVIRKFKDEEAHKSDKPYCVSRIPNDGTVFDRIINSLLKLGGLQKRGNLLLNEGINEVWTLLCSSSGTRFDAINAYLGVGDSSTTAVASQEGLQGSSKTYKGMDSGYPVFGTNQKATWRTTFSGGEANYNWREFTVSNGNSDSAKNLNRKVSDEGTKASGQVWELSLEITLS